jgi:hypothetical protein
MQGIETWNRDRVSTSTIKTVKRVEKEKKRVVNLDEFYADVEIKQAESTTTSDTDSDSDASHSEEMDD